MRRTLTSWFDSEDVHERARVAAREADFVIPPDIRVNGDVDETDTAWIAGRVDGDVTASEWVTIGEDGVVEGDVLAPVVEVFGVVRGGTITAERRTVLYASSVVEGTIHSPRLEVREGAGFTGATTMGSTPSEQVEHGADSPERRGAVASDYGDPWVNGD